MGKSAKTVLACIVIAVFVAAGLVAYKYYSPASPPLETGKAVRQQVGKAGGAETVQETLKIGAILPLTGHIAFIGQNFMNGLLLKSKELSQKKMEVIYEDSKAQPKEAINILNKFLINDQVKIIITTLSSVTNAVMPILTRTHRPILLLASITSKSDITTYSSNFFRYFLSSADEVNAMVDYFKKNDIDNIGVLHLNDDFGEDAVNVLKKLFDGKIVYEDTFTASQKDFKNITAKIRTLKDLYIIGYGPTYGLLTKQIRESGYKGRIYAFSSFNSPIVLDTAGEAAKGVIFSGTTFNPETPSNDLAKAFVRSYKNKYNGLPDHYAAYGYDIGTILAMLPETYSQRSEHLKTALLSMKHFNGVFGKTTIDSSGDFHFKVKLYKVSYDGKIEECIF